MSDAFSSDNYEPVLHSWAEHKQMFCCVLCVVKCVPGTQQIAHVLVRCDPNKDPLC